VCKGDEELDMYLHYLLEQGLTVGESGFSSAGWTGHVSVDGWRMLEADHDGGARTSQAFIAMWFDPETDAVLAGAIEPGIQDAGYKPLRVDKKLHNEKIDDHIIAEIRRSRFMVADFTGQRTAVYYEAGFARGLGIPVVSLCRGDELEEQKLCFDTQQYLHIPWQDTANGHSKLRERLRDHIVATFGQGPLPVDGND
jgi:nucleoside 2-deoxyribosyltransferase